MVKKKASLVSLVGRFSKSLTEDDLDLKRVMTEFLDLLVQESSAESALLTSYDGTKMFFSSGLDASSIVYTDQSMSSFNILNWGVLYIWKAANLDDEEFWGYIVSAASVFIYSTEIKEHTKLIASISSDMRKTLRPDIALEKIYDSVSEFFGIEEFYFFRKLQPNSHYEVFFSKRLGQGVFKVNTLANILEKQEISAFKYLSPGLEPAIFESQVRSKEWGLLVAAKRSEWTAMQKNMMNLFTEQLGIVFAQHELHSESLSMAQREFLLNQISTRIRESLDIDEIMAITAQEIAQVMGVESCAIMLFDSSLCGRSNYQVWSADQEYSRPMIEALRSSRFTPYQVSVQNPLISVSDVAHEDHPQAEFLCKSLGIKSYLSCAMYKDSRRASTSEILGIISVAFFNQQRTWSDDEKQLLEAISGQLEMALVQASIYQESQQTKREMALLYKLSSDIRNSLDISIVLGQIAKGIGEVLGLSRCFVRRFTCSLTILKTEQEYTASGIDPSADIIFGFEQEWISKLAQQNGPMEYLNIPNVRAQFSDPSLLKIVNAIQLKSYLSVPLVARGKLLGTINVHQCDRQRYFLTEEIEFISRVASEGAIAIEHADLFNTIDKMSKTEPDTGLYNKRYFKIIAEKEIAKNKQLAKPISFLMVDLDHLKDINDTPGTGGHDAGDEAILIAARVLERTVRQTPVDEVRQRISDVVGRFGGDEFMVLLPNTDIENAVRVAERVASNLAKERHSTWLHSLTCSIGVAGTPEDDYDYETLKRQADRALYTSKQKGRNTITSSLELK